MLNEVCAVISISWLLLAIYCYFQMDLASILFSLYSRTVFKFRSPSIFLTIDDVASVHFEHILSKLDKFGVKATFFVIAGTITEEKEGLLIKAIQNGHHLANHGVTDTPHWLLSKAELKSQIEVCQALLDRLYCQAKVPSPRTRFYRPGSGFITFTIAEYTRLNNFQLLLGSVYPMDSRVALPSLYAAFILWKISAGDVIIIHDREWTLSTLDLILPTLITKFSFASVMDE